MNILAIDSSSENISISILKGKASFNLNQRLKFGASKLIYLIDKSFKKHAINLKDIDVFVLGKGPGSFTGLRISFSIIKGFVLALKKPVVCVGSFYSIAYPFGRLHKKIAVISDARRELVYASSFVMRNGALCQDAEENLVSLPDFVRNKKDYFYVTPDIELYDKLSLIDKGIIFHKTAVYPKAKYFLETAQELYKKKSFVKMKDLEPLYLHPETCQIRR